MSLFKKTRLDRSVITDNKQPQIINEVENVYPRIEEETEVQNIKPMSLFKKTRLDRSLVADEEQPELVKETENVYPRIIEKNIEAIPNDVLNASVGIQKDDEVITKTEAKKTVNPYIQGLPKPAKQLVRLIPITREDEQSLTAMTISNEEATVINRANIDIDNPTISNKGHALIEIKNGQILLTNQTKVETTFIQVRQPTALHDGDIILLGNRLIRVEIENFGVSNDELED